MPRVKRRPHRRLREWTRLHRLHLLYGHDFIGGAFGDGAAFDVDSAREAWGELRGELLAEHVRERPRTRPWAWWVFDAPEVMRRTGTMRFKVGIGPKDPRRFDQDSREFVAEADFPRDDRMVHWKYHYQTTDPTVLDNIDDAHAVYETEAEYLERLGLLTPGEREGVSS